jgi:hypothetical protein
MSQDWRQLFGTIDVSTTGIRGTGRLVPPPQAKAPPAHPKPATPVAQPQPVKAAIQPPQVVAAPQQAQQTQVATSYPGVWTMAQTFTASAAQFVASGGKTVTREVREERLSICKMCPQYDGTRCIQCGCFIAAKTWVPHEKCPAGKWPA